MGTGIRSLEKKWKSASARRVLQMTGAKSVEEAIPKLAEAHLAGVSCPPTDLDAVRQKLGVGLCESADVIGSAALVKEGGKFTIICAPEMSPQRRRFTIAHELGHVIVDAGGRGGPRLGKELERLCDMLATEMLMPKQVFLNLASGGIGIPEIFRLASSFGTSLTTTAIRYAELLPVSAFEVDGSNIVWGKGVVRKGTTRQLDYSLRGIVEKALNGTVGDGEVHLNTNGYFRRWTVECHRYGKSRRVLVLMHLPRQS